MADPVAEAAIDGLSEKVQTLRTTWNRAVPIPSPDFKVIADRWQKALATVIQKWPDAFAGSDVDPAATVQRMEKIVAKIESLLTQLTATADEPAKPNLSPTEMLAAKLRNALASNAMGSRTGGIVGAGLGGGAGAALGGNVQRNSYSDHDDRGRRRHGKHHHHLNYADY